MVVNRLQPRFTRRPLSDLDPESLPEDLAAQVSVLRELAGLADAEDVELEPLLAKCEGAAMARVIQLDRDVHDLAGIAEVADQLLA